MKKLDRLDIAILATLQDEGRLANRALAERINLSPSACLSRVKRLTKDGYIRRFAAVLDVDKICANIRVHAEVTLEGHTQADFERFEKAVAETPEIIACDSVGGGHDYMVRFACADLRAYEALSQRLLDGGLGIKQMFSYIVIRKVKRAAGYPLARLLEPSEDG